MMVVEGSKSRIMHHVGCRWLLSTSTDCEDEANRYLRTPGSCVRRPAHPPVVASWTPVGFDEGYKINGMGGGSWPLSWRWAH
jgi:hypothetical protein